MNKCSFKVLRDVDHKVTHTFVFIHDIHVINTCLIVLTSIIHKSMVPNLFKELIFI